MWLAARAHSHTLPVALLILAVLALIGLLPLEAGLRYVVVLSMCWGIAAVGLDVFSGYLGQANFGQFAFVGIGAYAITALRSEAHLGVLPALAITLALVAVLSAVIGSAMVQLRHFGAVLTTFFFAFVLYNVLGGNALDPITHSETGLPVPPLSWGPLDLTANGPWLYWLAWAMLLVAVVLASNYANGRAGRALRLLKQSEPVAGTLGVRVRLAKLWAFVFSAVLAAAAGLPLSLAYGYLAPETFDPSQSITLFAMLVVGGIGSLAGPLIGALIFTALPQLMQGAGAAEALIFALIFLAFLVVLPDGIFGLIDAGWRRLPGVRGLARRWAPGRAAAPSPGPAGVTPDGRRPAGGGTTREHALVVEEVSMVFGGVRALDGVSFRVRSGTIHALVGPNGAGKTTLLNCASGLLRATSGRILVDEVDVSRSPAHVIRSRGVSRTFQNPSLVPDLTVLDNVVLGLYGSQRWSLLRDLAGGWASRRRQALVTGLAAEALRQVGLPEGRWQVQAGDLSLGEQKVVDVARAIAGGARLLMLDEPTSGLGDEEIRRVAELLRRLRRDHGLSILVVAHNVGFIQEISDTVTVLDFGRVIAEGEPERVIADPEVMTAYLGVAQAV
ncbi:MAG TPA: branched-chain amino acid ABC transporter ATP-binding protein/permease [Candidatus Dormibacteraeota bacterium]|jgi:branched-chain amino acid transport system permease protein|nr:branched-chain amino acid ABC transporter ATP-binding protein/permease [Candidatus Dormibacteraeota bacterium]